MERQKKSKFWDSLLFNKSIKDEKQEDGKTYINLGGENSSERVVQTPQEVLLQSKDENTGEWVTEYKETKIHPKEYRITYGYLSLVKQNVVIFSTWTGNGDFLHYTIIGNLKGKIVELVRSNDPVYNGDIFFEDGKLIQKSANRYSRWTVKNGRLVLIPYRVPKIPSALQIEFYISSNGNINVANNHYTVPVGTIVQFVRSDFNKYPEQGYFYQNEKSLDLVEYHPEDTQVFKIVKKGKIDGKIRCNSNFDTEITITIDAV
ncbi:hypothetical protein V7157_18330 [Neobacillus drentensis]|uniref:hypothetical protein n=1 Tax=Neobacillus drentensis TaxID=220684 RepID=UPI00300329C0